MVRIYGWTTYLERSEAGSKGNLRQDKMYKFIKRNSVNDLIYPPYWAVNQDFPIHKLGIYNQLIDGEYKGREYYYEGQSLNGMKHGWGVLHNKEYFYEGEFENNYIHGWGVKIMANGETHMGNFINGHLNGYALLPKILNWEKDFDDMGVEITEGIYENGKLCGVCRTYDEYGMVKSEANLNTGENKEGFGCATADNLQTYNGFYKNGKKDGKGIEVNYIPNKGNKIAQENKEWGKLMKAYNHYGNVADPAEFKQYEDLEKGIIFNIFYGNWKDGYKEGYGEWKGNRFFY